MNTEGTLAYRDRNGREHRVECSGGLDASRDRDGSVRVLGVVNVGEDDRDALREVMDRRTDPPAEDPIVRYSGQVRTEDGEDTNVVTDLPLRVQAVTGDGTVRLESDRVEDD